MEGKNRVKLLVSVLAIVIAFAVFIKPLASTVKQGLDLQGGTHVVLQAQETPESKVMTTPSTGPSRSSNAESMNWA